MVALPQAANTPENAQGMDDRTPIPAGDYPVHITKSAFKETKAKDGHRLVFTLKVLEGPHKDHTLFVGLNLNNPNPETVSIANKELNSMSQACGKVGVQDSDELHLIPFVVGVTLKPATAQYPEGNEVGSYKPVVGGGMIPPVAAPVAVPVAPAPVAPVTNPVAPVAPVAAPVPVAPVAPVPAVAPVAVPVAPIAPVAPVAPAAPVAPGVAAPAPGVAKLPWEV